MSDDAQLACVVSAQHRSGHNPTVLGQSTYPIKNNCYAYSMAFWFHVFKCTIGFLDNGILFALPNNWEPTFTLGCVFEYRML